jgi:hypothetical protein
MHLLHNSFFYFGFIEAVEETGNGVPVFFRAGFAEFFCRVVSRPVLGVYPEQGGHQAAPFNSVVAVDENGVIFGVRDYFQELDNIIVVSGPKLYRYLVIIKTQTLYQFLVAVAGHEVNYGFYAHFAEFSEPFRRRLGTPVNVPREFMEILQVSIRGVGMFAFVLAGI